MEEKKTIKDVKAMIREIQNKKFPSEIQEVKPVSESINKNMVQCNFNIHPDLKKRLKLRALEQGQGYKEIIAAALEEYLSR